MVAYCKIVVIFMFCIDLLGLKKRKIVIRGNICQWAF